MRWMIAVLALGLAACDGSATVSGDSPTPPAESYTIEIRAVENASTYLITAPDGRTVGARSAENASMLLDETRAQALAAEPPPQGEDVPEVMSLRVPGFEMSIGGTEEDANGDRGQVRISVGDGAQHVTVNADEGGPGDADDRAFVRITGADETAVREFLAEQEDLSLEVQGQMLAALGLAEQPAQ